MALKISHSVWTKYLLGICLLAIEAQSIPVVFAANPVPPKKEYAAPSSVIRCGPVNYSSQKEQWSLATQNGFKCCSEKKPVAAKPAVKKAVKKKVVKRKVKKAVVAQKTSPKPVVVAKAPPAKPSPKKTHITTDTDRKRAPSVKKAASEVCVDCQGTGLAPGTVVPTKHIMVPVPGTPQGVAGVHGVTVADLAKMTPFDRTDVLMTSKLSQDAGNKQLIGQLVNHRLVKANEAFAAKNYNDALKYGRAALAVDPTSAAANSFVNKTLTVQGVNPNDPIQRLAQGDKMASYGKNLEAIAEYRASLGLYPSADAHTGLGNIALRMYDVQAAKAEYEEALKINPSSANALRQLGLLEYQVGDVVGANTNLTRALVLNSKDTAASSALIKLWQHQVSINPNDASSHMGLARAYQVSGNLKDSQAEYKKAAQIEPNHPNLPAARNSFKLAMARQDIDNYMEEAKNLVGEGKWPEALQKVKAAEQINPMDTNVRIARGELEEHLGDIPAAHNTYLSVLNDEPQNALARDHLAKLAQFTQPVYGAPSPSSGAIGALATVGAIAGSTAVAGTAMAIAENPSTVNHVDTISEFLKNMRQVGFKEKLRVEKDEEKANTMATLARAFHGGGASPGGTVTTSPAFGGNSSAVGAAIATTSGAAAVVSGAVNSPTGSGAQYKDAIAEARDLLKGPVSTSSSAAVGASGLASSADDKVASLEQKNAELQSRLSQLETMVAQSNTVGAAGSEVPHVLGAPTPSCKPCLAAAKGKLIGMTLPTNSGVRPLPTTTSNTAVAKAVSAKPIVAAKPTTVGKTTTSTVMPKTAPAFTPAAKASTIVQNPMDICNPTKMHFEIEGYMINPGGVELDVKIRNEHDKAIAIKQNGMVVVTMPGQQPYSAPITFQSGSVAPRSEVKGIVKVPGLNISRKADVVLSGFLPVSGEDYNLHLKEAVAQK